MIPQTIAHYRITAKIGEGGMGEVYRATDTKLGREVAIKVLPEAFAQDADRMARFAREAQVLASLNHPNIAAIYGVEERALVMELVEGPTLSGPMAIEEALPIARQIAEALEYAHEKNVVHRDLKPANIKVTPDGRVKVLDFGLAKALSSESVRGDPASSPTLTMRATVAGVIMGTAAYMSPEQARGAVTDKRADIWAFGVVFYEMLTGRQMFAGDTISDTLAAVLRADFDWAALPPETPPAIRRLLRRCLERDRKRRLCDIGDARLEIEEALAAPESPAPSPSAPLRASSRVRWWLAGVSLAALAGLAVAVVHFSETAPEAVPVRFQIPLPEKTQLAIGSRLAVSPDGRWLAFNALGADGKFQIWVRSLDSLEARPLAGTEGAACVFWSPDSRWIAFGADGKLKKIEAGGGPPQTLCNTPVALTGGAWNRDGDILFSGLGSGGGLLRVSQAGGAVSTVTTLDRSRLESAHGLPQFLPDNRHFLYFALSSVPENYAVCVATLDGKEAKRILSTGAQAVYVPLSAKPSSAKNEEGHLLFLREGTLLAQPFDSRSLMLTGDAFPIAEQVWSYRTFGVFSASRNGVLAYRAGTRQAYPQLTWFDREGKPLGDLGPSADYTDVTLSRDGRLVAVSQSDPQGNRDIWNVNVARGVFTRFTFDPAPETAPVWSPDASRLVFASGRDGPDNLYQKETGGTRNEETLLKSNLPKRPLDWSSDGQFLIYGVTDPTTKADLWILPLEGDRKPRPFLQTPYNEAQAQFSPGPPGAPRWVAYTSDESGRPQIYVQPFGEGASGAGGKFQVSTGAGGVQPRWRADGKELYYIANESMNLMAVEVKTSPGFETGIPRALFTTRIYGSALGSSAFRYAVAPDGKRFLIDTETRGEETFSAPITVVLNWNAGSRK